MTRTIVTYLSVLAIALGLAYYASLPQSDNEHGSQDWLSINPSEISQLSYKGKNIQVEITPITASNGYWVKYTESKKPKKDKKPSETKEASNTDQKKESIPAEKPLEQEITQ